MRFSGKKFLGLAAIAALLVGLAVPTRAATDVHIGLSSSDVGALTLYIAQDKGFFKAEGLNSALVQFDSDPAVAQALTARAVAVAFSGITPVFDSYLAGRDLVSIWNVTSIPNYTWYGLSKYQDIKDIKGGKVGVANISSISYFMSQWAIARAGLHPEKDITFVSLGGPLNRVAALKAAQVDLIPATTPGSYLLAQDGFKPLLQLKDVMPQFQYGVLMAYRSTLAQNDAVLKSIMRAMVHAKHWAMANRNGATEILMERLGAKADQKEIYARTVDFALPYVPDDGAFAEESIDVMLGFYKDQGKLKELPNHKAFNDYRFIDYFQAHPVK